MQSYAKSMEYPPNFSINIYFKTRNTNEVPIIRELSEKSTTFVIGNRQFTLSISENIVEVWNNNFVKVAVCP